MKQIPNLFTLLNLVFGCIAIVYIFKTDGILFSRTEGSFSLGFVIAGVFIFLAAIVDFLDGFVARLFNATSNMGAQLDSLADTVSFGVAPSMILFQLLEIAFIKTGIQPSFVLLLPAFLVACCGVWRLARFNLDKEQTYYFKGVPIPAAGLTIASLPFIIYYGPDWMLRYIYNPYILYGVILIVSVLMVSKLPLISLKFKNFSIKSNLDKFIILIIAIISMIFFRWAAVPFIFVAYVLVSLIFKPNKK
ncbi:MAG TPA: CDP-diacylglycerol--serine O-phosphatidyltransferase [Niabella sp.]|nr:CDP-diacylglycerol--serine O-phosphatidyltransferase [Niabella sp.]HOZ97421.1 CDP-diacylglycerol--serine O-phosphatidyltransferase [Niabella sp.]HQW15211.1 CDP-diacylglycerol--serine O-phosphatidyltransferase [Niabella sp.]HQX20321.1 CDP-diacylglycerol--serine O-phosphatidyltransferase [Niabella sp.]HQX42312.1 CDP-diacylglycerol--serine O-phosphatidyltransferase [Niabella sp.]